MRSLKIIWVLGLAAGLTIGLLATMTAGALAAGGTSLCIPEAEGAATVTPTKGACAAKYKLTELGAEGKEGKVGKEGVQGKEGKEGKLSGLSEAEIKTLDEVLPYLKFVKEGVDKKPTIQFSGVNLQVINGSKSESVSNGTGNLIIGYDEAPGTQTGSHNLLLGTGNSYTSYGGIIAGHADTTLADTHPSSAANTAPPQGTQARSPVATPTRQAPTTPRSAAAAQTSPGRAPLPSMPFAPTPPTPASSPQSSAASATKPRQRTQRSSAAKASRRTACMASPRASPKLNRTSSSRSCLSLVTKRKESIKSRL